MLKDWFGWALREPSLGESMASFEAEPGITLRFREKLAPSRESSGPPEELRGLECGKDGLDMGEYDRGVDEGENDDT
jgi:hypothetical protein